MSCLKRQREDGVWEFVSVINQDIINRTQALETAKLSHDNSIAAVTLAVSKKIDQGNFTKSDSVIMGTGINSYVERDLAYLKSIIGLGPDSIINIPYAGTSTGTAPNYVIISPALTKALVVGQAVSFFAHAANNLTASTLTWSTEAAHPITKPGGGIPNIKNDIITVRWNGTNFVLQGEGASGNAVASDLLSGKTADTDAGPITGTLALTGSAIATDVRAGKTFYNTDPKSKVTGTLADKSGTTMIQDAATTHLPSLPDGFGNGGNEITYYGKIKIKLDPTNIGILDGSSVIDQYIYGLNPSVIKAGQLIGPTGSTMPGTYTSDGTATAGDIKAGSIAYVNGNKITGNRTYYPAGARPAGAAIWTGGGTNLYMQFPTAGGIWDNADVFMYYTIPTLIPSNIISGVDIAGVVGTGKVMPVTYNGTPVSTLYTFSAATTTTLSKLGSVTVASSGTVGFRYRVSKGGGWGSSSTCTARFQIYKNGVYVSAVDASVSFIPDDPMRLGGPWTSSSGATITIAPGDVIDFYGQNTYGNPGAYSIYQTFEMITSTSLI